MPKLKRLIVELHRRFLLRPRTAGALTVPALQSLPPRLVGDDELARGTSMTSEEEAGDRALYRYFLRGKPCPFLEPDGACGDSIGRPVFMSMPAAHVNIFSGIGVKPASTSNQKA